MFRMFYKREDRYAGEQFIGERMDSAREDGLPTDEGVLGDDPFEEPSN